MDLTRLLVDPTGVQTWRLGESELLTSTTELSQRIGELEALRLRMVHEVDTRGTAKTLGAASTAAWLSGATRMAPGAAAGIVHLGRALTELADTAEALATGRISTGHAKVVTGFFAHLPHGVPADASPSCERYLLDAAAVDNPVELARRAAALRHMLEPVEGSVPDAENTELNELFATVVGGRGLLKANLDAETMEMLQSALSALSKPRPSEDGTPDPRSPARRRADAFTEVLRRYLNSGEGPVEGAERHAPVAAHPGRRPSDRRARRPRRLRTTKPGVGRCCVPGWCRCGRCDRLGTWDCGRDASSGSRPWCLPGAVRNEPGGARLDALARTHLRGRCPPDRL